MQGVTVIPVGHNDLTRLSELTRMTDLTCPNRFETLAKSLVYR